MPLNLSNCARYLLILLLLIGQQSGLLHHLGHDFDGLGATARADQFVTPQGAPGQGEDEHDQICALCVGFAGALDTLTSAGTEFKAELVTYTRPLAAAPSHDTLLRYGVSIRAPPQSFCQIA